MCATLSMKELAAHLCARGPTSGLWEWRGNHTVLGSPTHSLIWWLVAIFAHIMDHKQGCVAGLAMCSCWLDILPCFVKPDDFSQRIHCLVEGELESPPPLLSHLPHFYCLPSFRKKKQIPQELQARARAQWSLRTGGLIGRGWGVFEYLAGSAVGHSQIAFPFHLWNE